MPDLLKLCLYAVTAGYAIGLVAAFLFYMDINTRYRSNKERTK